MKGRLGVAVCSAVLFASAVPLFAHHSGAAEFDSTKKIDLNGVVTKVEWTNPHAHFYLDVKDTSGVTNWNFELASPNVLIRNGWKRTSLKVGDHVNVTGVRAKDNPTVASAGVITFPDGHKLTFIAADNEK